MKKFIAAFLALISIFLLASCGGKNEDSKSSLESSGNLTEVLAGANCDNGDIFADVEQTIDPDSIYSNLEYTPSMFYGKYECDFDTFCTKADFSAERTRKAFSSESQETASTLPWQWVSGKQLNTYGDNTAYLNKLEQQTDYNWAALYFASSDYDSFGSLFKYDIEGNEIKLYEAFNISETDEEVTYELSETPEVYTFSFRGPYLTLSDGKNSVELKTSCFSEKTCVIMAYSLPNSRLIDGTDNFSSSDLTKIRNENEHIAYATRRDDSTADFDLKLCDNGVAYLRITDKDSEGNDVVTDRQFVYFIFQRYASLDDASFILADEKGVYDYSDTLTSREERINDGQTFTSAEVQKISDLYDDLAAEFEAQGIEVTIDKVNGEIAIDSTVVFAGDKAELTDEGKAFLDKFAKAYFSIITNDEYKDFIAGTKIEGHTAPLDDSTYESGLPLSQERADNVKAYIVASVAGAGNLEAVGMSNSKPVYDENGDVDMDACRRVSFSFIINSSEAEETTQAAS